MKTAIIHSDEAAPHAPTSTVRIGDSIRFSDAHGRLHDALVTAVWGNEVYDQSPPAVNLVIISTDPAKEDSYGRQIERHTSVVHRKNQVAHGNYWSE